MELAQVYCSREFTLGIYRTLAQDREFVEMLLSVWHIELSDNAIHIFRFLVMYRQPLVHTDSGYHIPSSEEVIAGIRAYFDPAQLSPDSAPSAEDSSSEGVRAYIMSMFRMREPLAVNGSRDQDRDIQCHLLRSIRHYVRASNAPDPIFGLCDSSDLLGHVSGITIPTEVSNSISKVSALDDLRFIYSVAQRKHDSDILSSYLAAWIELYKCLELPDAEPACECPWVYFFVKYCRDRCLGVPKLVLALHERMNIQLSREFIRCANPTCELNRLDQSAGQVKFKQCGGCKAVIYCSKECQTAHYPEHKRLCRERPSGGKGS